MTEAERQAIAITDVISAIPGTPTLVQWRKTGVIEEGEQEGVVFWLPVERPEMWSQGGNALYRYGWYFRVFAPVPENESTLDSNLTAGGDRPNLVSLIVQALTRDLIGTRPMLPGTGVIDFEIKQSGEWENQFKDGVELSEFGIAYISYLK